MSEENPPDTNPPREEARLLRRLHPLGDVGEDVAAPAAIQTPVGARCEKCGGTSVSSLPYFSAGSGLAFRPIANDVCCQRCGHIGPVDFA